MRTAIAELGLDPSEEFARPVTDDVLRGADVIATMGHSVGCRRATRGQEGTRGSDAAAEPTEHRRTDGARDEIVDMLARRRAAIDCWTCCDDVRALAAAPFGFVASVHTRVRE